MVTLDLPITNGFYFPKLCKFAERAVDFPYLNTPITKNTRQELPVRYIRHIFKYIGLIKDRIAIQNRKKKLY